MNRFFLNKKRIGFGIILFITLGIISSWLINEPETFIRNASMKKEYVQVIGFLQFIYSLIMLYSFIVLLLLLFRNKEAFVISESYLIDNSKFESVGKIYFSEIDKMKRIKKYSLEILLKEPILKSKRLNMLQKIAHRANNWNTKNSIVVSSALLNCDIKVLENAIVGAINKYNDKG